MGHVSLRVLSRLWPLCFIAAIGLMTFRHFDGRHAADGYLMGDAMVLCQLGLAGALCTGIQKLLRDPGSPAVRREAAKMLLRALDDTEAMADLPEDGRRHLRAVAPRSAAPSATAAGANSGPLPGA